MAKHKKPVDTIEHPPTLLIGVEAPYNKTGDIQSYYDEFLHLVKSNNIAYDQAIFVKIRSVDNAFFFTKGKLEEIKKICNEHNIREVIISEPLTAMQERNLDDLLAAQVFDRTQLILEIFEKSAHSAEGKMQVAVAMFQHKKSRVAGKGIHMAQQAGHIGTRGPGETAKEKALRHIEDHILNMKKQLKSLEKSRDVQRKRRLDSGVKQICLIGYTNTGKSTLLNRLTKADVFAADRLFATLDTTTRELYVGGKKKGVISDTVGFIKLLPHRLIEAFKSTLSELEYADLLLHVVDVSDKNWEEHVAIVHKILEDLNLQDKQMLYVFNKMDIPAEKIYAGKHEQEMYEPSVAISANSKEGVAPLVEYLLSWNSPSDK